MNPGMGHRVAHHTLRGSAVAALLVACALAGLACTNSAGTGSERMISTTPKLLDFGKVAGGATQVEHLTIANIGRVPLTLQSIRITSDSSSAFSVMGTSGNLAAGATLDLAVSFVAPMQAQAQGGVLEIDSNAGNAPVLLVPLAARVAASCLNTTCPPNASCSDTADGPVCTCGFGYVMQGSVCVSVCANNGGCDPNAVCTPGEAGGATCTCAPGFQGNGMMGPALVCTLANPCSVDNGGCDPHSTCMPMGTGVTCTCNDGYQDNGQQGTALVCTPVDPCTINNGGCDPHANCTPDGMGVTCTCNTGFRGNGQQGTALVCTPDNPCAIQNGGCDLNATCAPDGNGGVTCTCNPGYGGNGQTGTALVCTSINPCTVNNGGCDPNATCEPMGALAQCTCNLGYTGDGHQCTPIQAGHPSIRNGHVCNVKGDNSLWCWGLNSSGQVGNATITASGSIPYAQFTPYNVAPGTQWNGVAAGNTHTCGLQKDGSLWCWGDNSAGECGNGSVSPTGLNGSQLAMAATPMRVGTSTSWRDVETGWSSSCGLQADGSLWCWGDNSHGQAGVPASQPAVRSPVRVPGSGWTAVSCGHGFACGLQGDGSLWCWGAGDSGQTGQGVVADNATPVRVTTAVYSEVSAGEHDACALRTDGTLWCWGRGSDLFNTFSAGSASTAGQTPLQIGTVAYWQSISVNENVCGIRTDHSLWCAGPNRFGNLGYNDQTSHASFVHVSPAQSWQAVSVGASTCAQTVDGHLYCWGSDDDGELADGAPSPDTATQVQPGTFWQSAALGRVRDESLMTSWPAAFGVQISDSTQTQGSLFSWGGYGPFGSPQLLSQIPSAMNVGSAWVSVTAGDPVGCALDATGALSCFGTTDVGNGSNAPSSFPIRLDGVWNLGTVGLFNACGLQNGMLWCWGANADGELGNGTTLGSLMPAQSGTMNTWSAVSMGATHGCGISDGLISCWGNNSGGQFGNGTTTSSTTPVAANGTQWASVAAGFRHTCALAQNGGLFCWGQNQAGEVGDGTTTQATTPVPVPPPVAMHNWIEVTVSLDSATTCGVLDDGSLWCWGSLQPIVPGATQTTPYQLGTGTSWYGVTVIGQASDASGIAGDVDVCAIRFDDTLWCWGDNLYGQRGNGNAWRLTPVLVKF